MDGAELSSHPVRAVRGRRNLSPHRGDCCASDRHDANSEERYLTTRTCSPTTQRSEIIRNVLNSQAEFSERGKSKRAPRVEIMIKRFGAAALKGDPGGQSIIQTTSGILKRSRSLIGWRTLLMKSTHVCLKHMPDSGRAMVCPEQRRKARCFAGLHSTGRRRPSANLSLSSSAK